MIWLVWFLLCFGIVYLIVGASITAWPRRFLFNVLGPHAGGWLACAPCAAFWVGVAVGVPEQAFLAATIPLWALSSPFAVAVTERLAAGVILMACVVLVQLWTHTLVAELGAAEAARKAAADAARKESHA
jgi:hypothetical protein